MLVKLVYPETLGQRMAAMPEHATVLWRRAWWTELVHNIWRPPNSRHHEFQWRSVGTVLRVINMDCDIAGGVPHVQTLQNDDTWLPLSMLSNMQILKGSTYTMRLAGTQPFGLLPTRDVTRSLIVNSNPTAIMGQDGALRGESLRMLPPELLEHCEHHLPPLYGWRAKRPDELVALEVPVRLEDINHLRAVPRFDVKQLDPWDAVCWDNRHACFAV